MEHYPQRKSPRLQGYDYTQAGVYFVTICTFQREHLFGDVIDGNMQLNNLGEIAFKRWEALPHHFPDVDLDIFVVMPNHLHGLIVLSGSTQALSLQENRKQIVSGSLSAVVGSYKASVTRIANQTPGMYAPHIWQARYHDHIVRSEQTLQTLREYMLYNPTRWEEDSFHPSQSV